MKKILLSINPEYVIAIFKNKKTFELRRSIPKEKINKILIYETSPKSKVVGQITIKNTHKLKINELWKKTKKSNCINKKKFFEYFKEKKYGYAFEIKKNKKYKKPLNKEKFNINFIPQNFVYIK